MALLFLYLHYSAQCTEVQSDIDKKQERRLASADKSFVDPKFRNKQNDVLFFFNLSHFFNGSLSESGCKSLMFVFEF